MQDKQAQHAILPQIMGMEKAQSLVTFQAEAQLFKSRNAQFPQVVARFTQHWEADAGHWADFGRLEVLHLKCQTKNLLERFFQQYKYDFLEDKKCSSMQQMVCHLFDGVIPAYMHDRLLK